MNDIHVNTHGPIFDGRAQHAIRDYLDAAEETVAQAGERAVHAQLGAVLKHPTGYYESHVVTDLVGDYAEVTDDGVVYGPWLEGTSSRNETTHFKGYATFRKTAQKLQREAGALAERVLPPFLRRMQ
jgi:hypothetical protein